MSQNVNLGVALGANRTGLPIGYKIKRLNGVLYAPFTTAFVVESSSPGTYTVTVQVSVPDEGAIIVWGTSGADYLTSVIDPVGGSTPQVVQTGTQEMAPPYIRIRSST